MTMETPFLCILHVVFNEHFTIKTLGPWDGDPVMPFWDELLITKAALEFHHGTDVVHKLQSQNRLEMKSDLIATPNSCNANLEDTK